MRDLVAEPLAAVDEPGLLEEMNDRVVDQAQEAFSEEPPPFRWVTPIPHAETAVVEAMTIQEGSVSENSRVLRVSAGEDDGQLPRPVGWNLDGHVVHEAAESLVLAELTSQCGVPTPSFALEEQPIPELAVPRSPGAFTYPHGRRRGTVSLG